MMSLPPQSLYHGALPHISALPLSLSLLLPLFLSFHLSLAVAKKIRNLARSFANKLNHLKLILQGMLHGMLQGILATHKFDIVVVVFLLNLRAYWQSQIALTSPFSTSTSLLAIAVDYSADCPS